MTDGVVLQIAGIDVNFPFQPYPCQVTFMERVIDCLNNGQNGLLESPTGTGKTLCLLCATLSWLRVQRRKEEVASASLLSDGSEGSRASHKSVCSRVIYSSRTHGQLAQVIQELRRTHFASEVRATVLGSRSQLCIHGEVAKLKGSHAAQNRMCSALATGQSLDNGVPRRCVFRDRLTNILQNGKSALNAPAANGSSPPLIHLPNGEIVPSSVCMPSIANPGLDMKLPSILDVEDLVRFGRDASVCPFYLSKKLVSTSDEVANEAFPRDGKEDLELVLLPYNYILDTKARESTGIDLENAIVIFDEAHNLDGSCAEVASFDLLSSDVDFCIKQLDGDLSPAQTDPDTASQKDSVKRFLEVLRRGIEKVARDAAELADRVVTQGGEPKFLGEALSGSWVHELFRANGIDIAALGMLSSAIDRFAQIVDDMHPESHFNNGFEAVSRVLRAIVNTPVEQADSCFRIYVEECGLVFDRTKPGYVPLRLKPVGSWKFGFWCFSPSVSISSLISEHHVRSILLASGTLSPFDAMESELGISFPVRLENPHVVPKENIWAGVLPMSPSNVPLNSSYKTCGKPEYVSGIGHTLVNIMHIVPAGVLVFFPSYTLMMRCIDQWRTCEIGSSVSVWDQIEQEKVIFVEPKFASQLAPQIAQYQDVIVSTSAAKSEGKSSSVSTETKQNGATFFAVARGKVSEGIDFAGDNARAVVVVGLPFPNKADPHVNLKWSFLDAQEHSSSKPGVGVNSELNGAGSRWYSQQAMRAVNQSVGRVIRNIHDYGAIILCDERYMDPQLRGMLSAWIRPQLKGMKNFGQLCVSLRSFFRQKRTGPSCSLSSSGKSSEQPNPRKRLDPCSSSSEPSSLPSSASSSVPSSSSAVSMTDAGIPSSLQSTKKPPKQDAKAYLKTLKTVLTPEDFQTFLKLLNAMRRATVALNSVCSSKSSADSNTLTECIERIHNHFVTIGHEEQWKPFTLFMSDKIRSYMPPT